MDRIKSAFEKEGSIDFLRKPLRGRYEHIGRLPEKLLGQPPILERSDIKRREDPHRPPLENR